MTLMAGASVAGQDPAEVPNRSIPDVVRDELPFVSQRPGTELFLQRFRIIKEAGVRRGMTVAQIGVGDGVYTTLLARGVGDAGIVFAVDSDERALARVQEQAFAYHVDNIVSIVGDGKSIPLPDGGVQLLLMVDSYNGFEHPETILRSAIKALIPYGELVLVDRQRISGVTRPDIAADLRVDKVQAIEEITAAGLTLSEEIHFLKWSYFLRFRKTPEPDQGGDGPPSSGPATGEVSVGDIVDASDSR